jgi:hypothetical protein
MVSSDARANLARNDSGAAQAITLVAAPNAMV